MTVLIGVTNLLRDDARVPIFLGQAVDPPRGIGTSASGILVVILRRRHKTILSRRILAPGPVNGDTLSPFGPQTYQGLSAATSTK